MKSVEQYQFVVGQLGRPYDFLAGPGTEAKGINCQRLIEMFVQQYFSVKLPFTYRSEEIYMDNGDYFKNIDFYGGLSLATCISLPMRKTVIQKSFILPYRLPICGNGASRC